jgi:hypothetical protein
MAGTGPAMPTESRQSPRSVAARLSKDNGVAVAEAGQRQIPGLEEVHSNRIFASTVKAIPDTCAKDCPTLLVRRPLERCLADRAA